MHINLSDKEKTIKKNSQTSCIVNKNSYLCIRLPREGRRTGDLENYFQIQSTVNKIEYKLCFTIVRQNVK